MKQLILCFLLLIFYLLFPFSSISHADLSKEVDLSNWGLSNPAQIGWASVGVFHKKSGDELIIHDLRKQKPKIKEPKVSKNKIPTFKGDYFLLSHFDQGNQNRLGGFFNGFARSPAKASLAIEKAPDGTRALAFSYKRVPSTFAGFWIHLFNFRDPPAERYYMNASPFSFLTFDVRGAKGEENIKFQVADRAWEKKEDSAPVAELSKFTPSGKITTAWQRVWIPLDSFPAGVNKQDLAGLVFQVSKNGSGKIYIKDMAFTNKKDIKIPAGRKSDVLYRSTPKAMWLWKTDKITNNPSQQKQLLSFCKKQGVTELFIQIPYEADNKDGKWKITWNSSKVRPLIAALSKIGVKVQALDGDPRFALKKWHGRVLALINSIIEYNKEVPAKERFIGIRYDNEPYLLPSFSGVQTSSVLTQYMDLLKASKKLAATASLEYGVDVPLWFDADNEFFEPVAELDGKLMSEAIIDVVDNIGIMDYRTTAYGADGVIAQGLGELSYAAKKGKKVYIGLETVYLPDETMYEFSSKGPGLFLNIKDLGGTKACISLTSKEGEGEVTLRQNRSIKVPASKITFHDMPKENLAKVMQEAGSEFSRFPSFHGFVIHSYESYRPYLMK